MKSLQQILKEAIDITDNPNFWKWFRNSQVVDKDGNPLVLYHGTVYDFSAFKEHGDAAVEGERNSGGDPTAFVGMHFTLNQDVANRFANGAYGNRHELGTGRVMPVFLSLQNVIKTSEGKMWRDMMKYNLSTLPAVQHAMKVYAEMYRVETEEEFKEEVLKPYTKNLFVREEINQLAIDEEDRINKSTVAREMGNRYSKALMERGYDGVIYNNRIEGGIAFITFKPTQVKSAIGNNGNFDPNDPDITH